MQNIVDTIILRLNKNITLINKKFVGNIVFKLIHLEKAKLVHFKDGKKSINISYMDAIKKIEQSKLDSEFPQKCKPNAKFILLSTLKLNIFVSLNTAISPNQIAATIISKFLNLTIDIYLIIYKDKKLAKFVNIRYIVHLDRCI